MIDLQEVTKVYHTAENDVLALNGVSLHVARGEFLAVRGPSGCGKSTLLALLGGLASASSGSVTVSGNDLSTLSTAQRAAFRADNIGFVFQVFHLLPYLDIVGNILVAAPSDQTESLRSRALELLDSLGLASRRSHMPSQLSIGERQRVAMARALLNQPKLLLADEPTGNLDEENSAVVLKWMSDFNAAGGTVVLVTHDEQAAACATRTILLREGKLESDTQPSTAGAIVS